MIWAAEPAPPHSPPPQSEGHLESFDMNTSEYDPNVPKAVFCRWADCKEMFSSVELLGAHLNEAHVGKKQSNYVCEWANCLRNSEPLPNRFAIIAHLRRHTGERPYTCNFCNKSFSRSDALSKHARVQHGGQGFSEPQHNSKFNEANHFNSLQVAPSTYLKHQLEYLEAEKTALHAVLAIKRTKIKRIRAEKAMLLEMILKRQNFSN